MNAFIVGPLEEIRAALQVLVERAANEQSWVGAQAKEERSRVMSYERPHREKHMFELQGIKPDGERTIHIEAGFSKDTEQAVYHGLRDAEYKATDLLAQHPELDVIQLYHTYPAPGPTRRFVETVRR